MIFFINNNKIDYEYDFGDGWGFTIEFKKTVDYDKNYPTLIRYKGKYNPIEDCGGIWGLEKIIYLKNHPNDPEYEENDYLIDELKEFDFEFISSLLEDLIFKKRTVYPDFEKLLNDLSIEFKNKNYEEVLKIANILLISDSKNIDVIYKRFLAAYYLRDSGITYSTIQYFNEYILKSDNNKKLKEEVFEDMRKKFKEIF